MGLREPTPEELCELSIWLAADEELIAALAPLCQVDPLRPDDWDESAQGHPAFLLVQGGDAWERSERELDRLLERCEGAGIPALLWITGSPVGPCWLERCHHFERVFTVDGGQLPELEGAGARQPQTLWPASDSPPGERIAGSQGDGTDAVLWLGGWNRDWPAPWRERLAAVLRGAGRRGLRIVETADTSGLPSDLSQFVDATAAGEDRGAALRRAKVVIGADPLYGSPRLAPQIVFAAGAAGTAVITPHDFLSFHDFAVGGDGDAPWHNLVPIVHDPDITAEEIDRLLEDDVLYREVVDHLGRIVANNHTYAHRLATLASATGFRLVPDARSPAPA